MTTIGERLREERTRLGLSQTDLASTGGVGKTTQINYEKCERSPDAAYLAAAAAVGVDVLYVLTGRRTPVAADALAEDEAELLDNYRKLAEKDRTAVQSVTLAMARMAEMTR